MWNQNDVGGSVWRWNEVVVDDAQPFAICFTVKGEVSVCVVRHSVGKARDAPDV